MRRGNIESVRISVSVLKTFKQLKHFVCFAFYSAQCLNNGMYENLQQFRQTVEIGCTLNQQAADRALRSPPIKEGLNWLRGEIRKEEKERNQNKKMNKSK